MPFSTPEEVAEAFVAAAVAFGQLRGDVPIETVVAALEDRINRESRLSRFCQAGYGRVIVQALRKLEEV